MAEIFSTEEAQKGTMFPRLRMKSVEARHRENSSEWKLVRFRSPSAPIQGKGSGSAFFFFFWWEGVLVVVVLCKEHVVGAKKHVLGVINSLNSQGRMWVS